MLATFGLLAKLGWTILVLLRKVTSLPRGRRVYARPWWYRNRFRDLEQRSPEDPLTGMQHAPHVATRGSRLRTGAATLDH
jgi:hypothetical protein